MVVDDEDADHGRNGSMRTILRGAASAVDTGGFTRADGAGGRRSRAFA